MPKPPWARPHTLAEVVDAWVASDSVRPCLHADRELGPQPASFGGEVAGLHPSLHAALRSRGVEALYDHQVEAIEAVQRGQHVAIATPTASGKSLCFHLPVLDALIRDPEGSVLYLYPTKALSRDQETNLRAFIHEAGLAIPAVVYDGDTPGDARRAARDKSSIIMTNPDMLHTGILPHHAHWARMFQRLKYVVIDEMHIYRGVFGSHVAHVLARLARVAAFHGSSPTFIGATATIGNPGEHAARLFGTDPSEVHVVERSGAPRGARRVFLYNPPVVNAELGIRASYIKRAVKLTTDLIRARVPTIVFGPSRNSVEIMLKYLRDFLEREKSHDPTLAGIDPEAIVAYRGGYLPEQRRRVEEGLRNGRILCVVATNALELGIDIGDLDAVVCAGYPGSIAETWQRFGRAGRRGSLSVAILVTNSDALNQYLAVHSDELFDRTMELARIDPQNPEIVIQHLKCAAFELPFVADEPYGPLEAADTLAALRFLASHGVLHEASGRFHWATDAYPANHVSLRSIGWDNYVIIDESNGRALAELDWRATPTMLHEQAIYQHDGEQYQVERLDFENHKAYVRKVEPDYFTTAMTHQRVSVLDVQLSRDAQLPPPGDTTPAGASDEATAGDAPFGTFSCGEVSVVEKVVGFKKIKFHTHENAGYGEVRLPDVQKHTTSFWWSVPEALLARLGVGRAAAIDALRGVGRALETVSTLALMCDPRDLGQTLIDSQDADAAGFSPRDGDAASPEDQTIFEPTIFVYDHVPGGIGLAAQIYESAPQLLAKAFELIAGCACQHGCPLCVGPILEPGSSRRPAAVRLLELAGAGHGRELAAASRAPRLRAAPPCSPR